MTNNMRKIVFIGFVNDYDKLDIESLRDEFNIIHIKLPKIIFKLFKRIIFIKSFYEKFIYLILNIIISRYSNIDLLVFKDEPDYLPYVNKFSVKSILILRNILSPEDAKFIKENNITALTFDKIDSIKYNLLYYPQFSSVYSLLKKKKLFLNKDFDLCFLGKDKGRKKFIDELNNRFKKNYSTNFIIVDSINKHNKLIKNRTFSYINYLNLQLSCSTILDIAQNNQSSETMRFIEALSSGRKVITNVESVIYHELYNCNNVLYFDNIDCLMSQIDRFMQKPFKEYSEESLMKYSSKYVLCKIITSCLLYRKD